MLTRTITRKSLSRVCLVRPVSTTSRTVRLDQFNLVISSVVLAVGIYLQVGHWFGGSKYEERVELGVIPFLLLLLIPLLLFSTSRLVAQMLQGPRSLMLAFGTLGIIFPLVAIKPVVQYPYLWHGFGWVIAGLSFLAAVLVASRTEFVLRARRHPQIGVSRTSTTVAMLVLFGVYLPTFIQTSRGIINLGDASHQVLEEISGPLVGKFPGVNYVSTYTSLLGVPLVALRPFGFSGDVTMTIVLFWVNLLVLAVPTSLVLIARRIYPSAQLAPLAMLVVAPILVSGWWGSAASNVESLSMIPGRSLGPVILGLVIVGIRTRRTSFTTTHLVTIGFVSVLVLVNNFEFGFGAFVAAFLLVVLEGLIERKPRGPMLFACGALLGASSYLIGSLVVAGPYDYRFRFASYFGKPYSPAEYLPSWSLHSLILALFCSSVVLGVIQLRVVTRRSLPGSLSPIVSRAAVFFGLWGILAFPYCAYRCVEGMYMSTQIYLIPAVMCSVAIIRLVVVDWSIMGNWTLTERLSSLPALFIIGLGFFSVLQAPNPINEWMRVGGSAITTDWAVLSDRPPANEWSTKRIDWIDVDIFQPFKETTAIGYFGYMGNSVELATGIENLTQINSGEILQIKGTDVVKELACQERGTSKINRVLILGIENQCKFTSGFTAQEVGALNILIRGR